MRWVSEAPANPNVCRLNKGESPRDCSGPLTSAEPSEKPSPTERVARLWRAPPSGQRRKQQTSARPGRGSPPLQKLLVLQSPGCTLAGAGGRTPASGTTLPLTTPTDHSCGLGQVVLFCKMRARAWPLLIFFPALAFCDLVILSFQWKTLPEEWS